ncbi:MAG: hypothetical protein IJX26_02630, partial [Clostridia bacterium]|nr:hypothetical protein [Clostridia bacterium]
VSGLSSGEISISITATSSLSNAFASSNISLAYTQLETPVLEVKEGKLYWQINPNASYYILSYYSFNEWIKINLNNTNYDVIDNYASYDFKTVPSGYINFKLQAISNLTEDDKFYFDSQESITKNTTKLSKPTVNYNNGEINLNFIASEVDYIDSVIISTQTKNVNLLDLVDEITANSVISPEKLLSYISADAIEEEKFSVVIYAKDSTDYLDSNSFEFGAK